jgi:hypothetical protein
MLKRHYEYWHCAVALYKLDVLMISSTHFLIVKDVKCMVKTIGIKMIIEMADKRITDVIIFERPSGSKATKVNDISLFYFKHYWNA